MSNDNRPSDEHRTFMLDLAHVLRIDRLAAWLTRPRRFPVDSKAKETPK